MSQKVVLLLGGGLDSTALLHFYKSRQSDVTAVHFFYGQPSFQGERQAAEAVAEHYEVPLHQVDLGFKLESARRNGELHGRNAMFLLAAASMFYSPGLVVALGINAGAPFYYDCSERFIGDMNNLANGYFDGAVQFDAPFVQLEKPEIFSYSLKVGVPVGLTFSCLTQNTPCGHCASCRDREELFERFQVR